MSNIYEFEEYCPKHWQKYKDHPIVRHVNIDELEPFSEEDIEKALKEVERIDL